MSNRKKIEADVHNLIALCHIIDDYDEFSKNLFNLISTKYNRDIIYNLYKISKGDNIIGSRKVKKFYQNNKKVIDRINEFSNISNFINYNYDWHGKLSEGWDFLYKYINAHKQELEKMLSVLEKIKRLGIDNIQFDETKDFTTTNYAIYDRFSSNYVISYLDNIEVIPNYQSNIIKYRTKKSDYEIVVGTSGDILSKRRRTIIVNSLTFDYKKLPKEISKGTIFDKIINLNGTIKEDCNALRDSVNLSVALDDLYSEFSNTSSIIESLNDADSKEQLREILLKFKLYLDQAQAISSTYDDRVSENFPITKENLQEEKQLYLQRRYLNSIDFD